MTAMTTRDLAACVAQLGAENDALKARIAAGMALHYEAPDGACEDCWHRWPCPTTVALEGKS